MWNYNEDYPPWPSTQGGAGGPGARGSSAGPPPPPPPPPGLGLPDSGPPRRGGGDEAFYPQPPPPPGDPTPAALRGWNLPPGGGPGRGNQLGGPPGGAGVWDEWGDWTFPMLGGPQARSPQKEGRKHNRTQSPQVNSRNHSPQGGVSRDGQSTSRPQSSEPAGSARGKAAEQKKNAKAQQKANKIDQKAGKAAPGRESVQGGGGGKPAASSPGKQAAAEPPATKVVGNTKILVHQLLEPGKRLGLNLRGVKVEKSNEDVSSAGWRQGDIITTVNGTKVSSFDEFSNAFHTAREKLLKNPNEPIEFMVYRASNSVASATQQASKPGSFRVSILNSQWTFTPGKFVCKSGAGVAVRPEPHGTATTPRRGASRQSIETSQVFQVSNVSMGADQRMYLQLAEGEAGAGGWVFDDSQVETRNPTVEKVNLIRSHEAPNMDDPLERLLYNLSALRSNYVEIKHQEEMRRATQSQSGSDQWNYPPRTWAKKPAIA